MTVRDPSDRERHLITQILKGEGEVEALAELLRCVDNGAVLKCDLHLFAERLSAWLLPVLRRTALPPVPRRKPGPKPFATPMVRLGLRLEPELVRRVDERRAALIMTRAGYLRSGLRQLVERLEADPKARFPSPMSGINGLVQVPTEITEDLHARAQALIAEGRASSMVELVRGGVALLEEVESGA